MVNAELDERSPRIDIVVFDLDGTILERGKVIPQSVKKALGEVVKQGVKIATASGRCMEDQVSILERNGLGATSGFPHFIISDEQEIYFLMNSRYEPYERYNYEMRRAWLRVWPEARKMVKAELKRLSAAGIPVRLEFSDLEVERQRGKITLLFERIDDAKAEESYLKTLFPPNGPLTCNRRFSAVQILHSRAGKGNTLKALSEYLNVSPSRILCVGDSAHDISMLDGRYGFLSATTSNAEEEVKEAVRSCGGYVASKPCGEGVLEILHKMGLLEASGERRDEAC
ncbi:MAG: hypothetical protein AYL33_002960 [Candidatus Bathyarchaeota archaeon B63]|nr:MAG: hypothetical protein AYL33_002960 [Candidatus Bathyarchaeota archaeon B63]